MYGVRRSAPTQPGDVVNRLFEDSDFEQTSYQWANELVWDGALGGTEHEVSLGLDLRKRGSDLALRRGAFPATSITDPVYGFPAPPITTILDLTQDQDWLAAFVQDQIDLFDDDLHVNLAGRYDKVDQENASGGPPSSSDDDAFTARAGALYDLTEDLGVYASAGQSFLPQSPGTVDVGGNQLDPETGLQYEVGLKKSWNDGRLWTTLALYQLTKDDVAIGDALNPGFSINAGKLRSEGIEFEAAGAVNDRVSVVASYAYTNTEVLSSSSLPVGAPFRNVPENAASAWVKYDFGGRSHGGWAAGVGAHAVSQCTGDDQDSFSLPGYFTFDFGLFYDTTLFNDTDLSFQLNVFNLFDEVYYESSLANSRVFPGTPRSGIISLSLH